MKLQTITTASIIFFIAAAASSSLAAPVAKLETRLKVNSGKPVPQGIRVNEIDDDSGSNAED